MPSPAFALPLLSALALAIATPAFGQDGGGSLRERIRERLEQRRALEGQTAPDTNRQAGPLGPGDHEQFLDHQNLRRRYLVHVPPGYDPARPTPLVIAFHGGGGHAEYMADDAKYGLIGKADQAGFIVVFPNGYSKMPRGRLATWNAGGCCGDARDRAVDDVGFSRAMVASLREQLNIDGQRIFATGMSNGGMISHRLACDAADLFRAVAAVAGTEAAAPCHPSRPISVLHIHARDDTHVLFNGGAGPDAFRDPSKVMEFVSVPETIARWRQRNHCPAVPQRTLDKPGAYCETYAPCQGGTRVQLCVTETGGHSWPGAASVRRGKAAASQELNANDVIWDFFRSQ